MSQPSSSTSTLPSSSSNASFDDSDGSSSNELLLNNSQLDQIPPYFYHPHAANGYHPKHVHSINISHNSILSINSIAAFINLSMLDVSNNNLANIPDDIGKLSQLRTLVARNNLLETLPKTMCNLENVEELYLSGNRFDSIPSVLFNFQNLRILHMGANKISIIPYAIRHLQSLEVLYLGGNQIVDVPATIGLLSNLTALALCDNDLETIPSTLGDLHHLESLNLHNNKLTTLPTSIINLQNLQQLSLRNNPLVNNFVHNMSFDPPSLKELSGRIVRLKMHKWRIRDILPHELYSYLQTACQCVNPKCKGVYFEARVEHVKFVDFCGKYRVPLLQFLCSPGCSSGVPAVQYESSSESEEEFMQPRMRKVLLG